MSDVKELTREFEAKLRRKLSDLNSDIQSAGKIKENYEKDIARLNLEASDLGKKVKRLNDTVANAISIATEGAMEKIKQGKIDLDAKEKDVDRIRSEQSALNTELKGKIADTDKLKDNLQKSIENTEKLQAETNLIKTQLLTVLRQALENLENING